MKKIVAGIAAAFSINAHAYTEQQCVIIGDVAAVSVQARDAGMSYLDFQAIIDKKSTDKLFREVATITASAVFTSDTFQFDTPQSARIKAAGICRNVK